MTREELHDMVYLFAETYNSSKFNTGSAKRLRQRMFNDKEWEYALKIIRRCSTWALKTGIPQEKKFEDFEYLMWKKIESFCLSL